MKFLHFLIFKCIYLAFVNSIKSTSDKYCITSNNGSCLKCLDGFYINNSINLCQSKCFTSNSYLNKVTNQCELICPEKTQIHSDYATCEELESCPSFDYNNYIANNMS